MAVLTKTGAEVFAGYTSGLVPRSIDPAEVANWATEIEIAVGLDSVSATARLGKFYVIPTDTVAVINVPADVATLQDAIDGTMTWFRAKGGLIRIVVTGHQAATATIGTFHRTDGMPMEVVGGTASVPLTFSSFAAPAGTKGNRTIDVTVADGSSVTVGDVVTMRDFPQSYPISGSKALPSGPASGSFQYGYNIKGDANTLISVAGTTLTFSQAVTSSEAPVDSLIVIQKQCRRITARPTDTTATLSSPVKLDLASFVYWAIMKCEAGTLSSVPSGANSTLTGSGTALSTVLSPSDIAFVEDTDSALVVSAIANATSATAEKARTFTGKRFAVLNRWWELETCFLVTAKPSANVMTLRHESWSAENLPFRNLVPGSITCYKDSLSGTAAGCIFNSGGVKFDNIALKGNSLGAGLDGSDAVSSGKITITSSVSVIGFYYGAHFEGSMTLVGGSASFHGAAHSCLYFAHGATLKGDSIRAHGAAQYSLLIDLGADAYLSRFRFCCSREDAIRGEVGGAVYSDWGVACSNGGRAFQLIGQFKYHLVGAMVGFNGGEYTGGGLDIQNTGGGRSSGMFVFCNYGVGFNSASGYGEASYLTSMGNTGAGIGVSGSGGFTADRSGVGDNDSYALDTRNGRTSLPESVVSGNDGGILALKLDHVDLQGAYIDDNSELSGRNDISVYAGSRAYVQSIVGAPTMNVVLNEVGEGGALVYNDAKPISEPVRYRTGDQTTRVTISISASLFTGTASTILNGVTSGETTTYFVNGLTVDATRYIRFDFDAESLVTEATWIQSNAVTHGVWKWQASDNAVNWTDIGSSFTLGGSAQVQTQLNGNRAKYRYYQLVGVSGTTSGSPYLQEIQFKR